MQLYIGREQPVRVDDTLHVRCYREENLKQAMRLAGFIVTSTRELVLPLQVSFKELGIEAVIVGLERVMPFLYLPKSLRGHYFRR